MTNREEIYNKIKESGTFDSLKYQFPYISVPSFTFNGVTCKNVDFVWMGQTPDKKDIYMSTDCLPEVQVSMDDLLKIDGTIQTDKGVGECDIGKAAATSLETAISSITGMHLQPYTRTYDGHTSSEKVFFPLECEVQGVSTNSSDAELVNKYPQWASFKGSSDSKIKYIDYSSNKYAACSWWGANKAEPTGNFCCISTIGDADTIVSSNSETGGLL